MEDQIKLYKPVAKGARAPTFYFRRGHTFLDKKEENKKIKRRKQKLA